MFLMGLNVSESLLYQGTSFSPDRTRINKIGL